MPLPRSKIKTYDARKIKMLRGQLAEPGAMGRVVGTRPRRSNRRARLLDIARVLTAPRIYALRRSAEPKHSHPRGAFGADRGPVLNVRFEG